jgi:hypothetical protein
MSLPPGSYGRRLEILRVPTVVERLHPLLMSTGEAIFFLFYQM